MNIVKYDGRVLKAMLLLRSEQRYHLENMSKRGAIVAKKDVVLS